MNEDMRKIALNFREPCACGNRTYGCWEKSNWKFKSKKVDNPKIESAYWLSLDALAYNLWAKENEREPCTRNPTKTWMSMDTLPNCYLHMVPILIAKEIDVFMHDMKKFTGSVWHVEMAMWQITGNSYTSKKGVWLHTNETELEEQEGWTHWMDLPEGPKA